MFLLSCSLDREFPNRYYVEKIGGGSLERETTTTVTLDWRDELSD